MKLARGVHPEYLESQMANYDRRIRMIKENPDPTRPKANVLLYEAERDLRKSQLQGWINDEPFGRIVANPPLVRALGMHVCDMTQAADRTHGELAQVYFDMIRREGYTDNACDRTTVLLPMVLNGDFPAPDFIATCNHECGPIYLALNSIARQLNIPLFCVDRPPRFDEDALKYMADQFGQMIEFAEANVPSLKYDEDRLIEIQHYERQWHETMADIYELRKRVPCPVAGRESFREHRYPSVFPDPAKIVTYQELYRDELYERAERGEGAVKEERLRLLWTVSGPFYDDPFGFLGKLGVSVPFWQVTNYADLQSGRQKLYGDETEFGRKLTPLEEEARMANVGWGDLADRWLKSTIDVARDMNVGGIIYYLQWGCTVTNNLGKVMVDLAERELGIPTLLLEGRHLDETTYDRHDFYTKLVDFVNLCFERKRIPRLTHDEIVRAGFTAQG